ncbi:hypothetical protein [Streptomyces clavifer]|uniref:hypothetical protein n=1 Tax=Streptomyces clavifer TaxID=68188 RepID=UPI00308D725B|nr:hypothetical protein OG388_26640 [Streptomyces clavifer]
MPIAVIRAETFYVPPPPRRGYPAEDWSQVPGAELVYRFMEYRTGRRIVPPTDTVDQTYYARVNHNRWLADCVCGSAQIVSPDDPRYGCTECGYGWAALIFPDDVAAVEAELLAIEEPHLRNWWHPDDPANPYRIEPDPVLIPEVAA